MRREPPLEWTEIDDAEAFGDLYRGPIWHGSAIVPLSNQPDGATGVSVGDYTIERDATGRYVVERLVPGEIQEWVGPDPTGPIGSTASLDAAKAIAEADYDAWPVDPTRARFSFP